jgi:hypothetical protein
MSPEPKGNRPLVIVDPSGEIVDVTTMNRKGFTKSTEQGELWFLHEETGRVLPYDSKLALVSLSDEGRWFRAVVEGQASRNAAGAPKGAEGVGDDEGPQETPLGRAERGSARRGPIPPTFLIRVRRRSARRPGKRRSSSYWRGAGKRSCQSLPI